MYVRKIGLLILLAVALSIGAMAQSDSSSGEAPNGKPAADKAEKNLKTGEKEETPAKKDAELPPGFKTDGCTMFPDGNYRDCCVKHDIDYYKGGSLKERRKSDIRLYRCVKKKKGWQNKFLAPLMYIGVRVGGVPFLPTPFRWGFGRNRMKKLKRLEEEKRKAQEAAVNGEPETALRDPEKKQEKSSKSKKDEKKKDAKKNKDKKPKKKDGN